MNTSASSSQSVRPFVIAFSGALIVAASIGIGRFAYTPLLPQMLDVLGWNVAQAGDVASSNYLGYLVGAVLTSFVAQRRNRHIWLFLGCGLSFMSTLTGFFVDSFSLWLLLRFIGGVASAFGFVLATAVVMQVAAEHKLENLMAVHYLGPGIGIISSVIVIEIAKVFSANMYQQWALLGFVAMFMFLASWLIMRNILPQHVGQVRTTKVSSILYPKKLIRVIIAYAIFGFAYVITATFIVTIARGSELSVWLEPLTWVAVGLGVLPSLYLWLKLASRTSIALAFRLSFIVLGVAVLLSGLGINAVVLLLSGFLLGFTIVGSTGLGIAAARELSPNNQDSVIAWMTASFGVGQLLGPAIAGRLALVSEGFLLPCVIAFILSMFAIILLQSTSALTPTSKHPI